MDSNGAHTLSGGTMYQTSEEIRMELSQKNALPATTIRAG
jgi:hypothetical protein